MGVNYLCIKKFTHNTVNSQMTSLRKLSQKVIPLNRGSLWVTKPCSHASGSDKKYAELSAELSAGQSHD